MSNDQEASVSNIELNSQYTGSLGGAVIRHTLIFFVVMFIWEMANRTGFSNPLFKSTYSFYKFNRPYRVHAHTFVRSYFFNCFGVFTKLSVYPCRI